MALQARVAELEQELRTRRLTGYENAVGAELAEALRRAESSEALLPALRQPIGFPPTRTSCGCALPRRPS
eukprot:4835854-Prymnesium_polylepis.2